MAEEPGDLGLIVARYLYVRRQLRRLERVRRYSILLVVLSLLSLGNVALSVMLRGTELGAAFETIVWLMQPVIGLGSILLIVMWMSVYGLIEHVDREMEALRHSEADFRRQR